MTYVKIKTREELTGCTCGSKEVLNINSPITGYTCPDCGATKDRLKKLEKAFAAARELIEGDFKSLEDHLAKISAYTAAAMELEE